MAEEEEEKNEPIIRQMTRAHFRAVCSSEFNTYVISDDNPVVTLSKEIKNIQKEIEGVVRQHQLYERTLELIVKHQENFLHKVGALPKHNTRTVGVNVNITPKPDAQKLSSALHSLKLSAAALTKVPSTTSNVVQQSSGGSKSEDDNKTKFNSPSTTGIVVQQGCGVSKSIDDNKTKFNLPSTTSNVAQQSSGGLKSTDDGKMNFNLTKQGLYGTNMSHSESVPNLTRMPLNISPKNYSKSTENVATLGAVPSPLPHFVQIPNVNFVPTTLPVQYCTVSPNVGLVHPFQPRLNYVIAPNSVPVQKEAAMQIRMNRLPPPGTVLLSSLPNNLMLKRPGFRVISIPVRHPAPLPERPKYPDRPNEHPPKPMLNLSKNDEGVVLSWNMPPSTATNPVENYEIFSYEETKAPIDSSLWKKVGAVKSLALPMACTLTQCAGGHRYHFSIRACDSQKRLGPFSDIASILLPVTNK